MLYPSATESLIRDVAVCQQRQRVRCCKTDCQQFLGCPIVQAVAVQMNHAGEEGMVVEVPQYQRPKRLVHRGPNKNGTCHVVVQGRTQ